MKIACVISSLRLGGAERQLIGLAQALSAAGYDTQIVTYHDENFYVDAVEREGLRHTLLTAHGTRGVVRALSAMDAEVMISFLAGTNLKACLAKRRNPRLKLVVSERTCNNSLHLSDLLRFALYRRYADMVVCNNFAQERFIRRHCPRLADKLATVPNFVNTEMFCPSETMRPRGAGVSAENVLRFASDPTASRSPLGHIVVTARVCYRKNAIGLIQAAEILRQSGFEDFRIDWYGLRREDRYCRKCRKMISDKGLQQHFFLHQATADVADVYRNADFFCLPSFYEGTSNALAEALASGLPAACGRVSDNVRYVADGENGFLFDPHNPADIADKLGKLLSLSDEQKVAFGASSRNKVENGLSREAFAEGWRNILIRFGK